MLNFLPNKLFLNKTLKNNPTNKILLTLIILCIFRFGNSIPLANIDQEALKKAFFENNNQNSLMQVINMYSGGAGKTVLSPFSLGIIPFINSSILVDLLAAIFPYLEKLQSEEGELGRQKLNFYKKILSFVFSIIQSIFLIFYLKSYFYVTDIYHFLIVITQLVSGSMIIIWLSSIIDNKGIGNGTSLIIFTNIIVTLIGKNIFTKQILNSLSFFEILFLLVLIFLICISQTARVNIDVVSARQLAILESTNKIDLIDKIGNNLEKKESGLSIKLNQAGIFPIIIASNLIPFITYFNENVIHLNKNSLINSFIYYILVIGFNYFYTIIFWDPEKIAEQLRKASVSIVNLTPGKDTVSYLENIVRGTSINGGIFLCFILLMYDLIKQFLNTSILNQLNISSLIILVGVAYEIQRVIRSMYINIIEN